MNDNNYSITLIYDLVIGPSYEWEMTDKIQMWCKRSTRGNEGWTWITGKILEEYVWWNIRNGLEEAGYTWRRGSKKLNTYYMKKNYQTKRAKKNGGIDIFLSIIDEFGNKYYCKVECSNWKKRRISFDLFKRRIYQQHKKYSASGLAVKVEIIPYDNVDEIQDMCDEKDIFVIAIDEQLIDMDFLLKELGIT